MNIVQRAVDDIFMLQHYTMYEDQVRLPLTSPGWHNKWHADEGIGCTVVHCTLQLGNDL